MGLYKTNFSEAILLESINDNAFKQSSIAYLQMLIDALNCDRILAVQIQLDHDIVDLEFSNNVLLNKKEYSGFQKFSLEFFNNYDKILQYKEKLKCQKP